MFSDRTKFHSSPHPHNISCIFCITIITYMKFMHITFIIYINRQSSTKTSINFMCITHILYIMLCTQDLLQSSSITGVLTQESFSQECFHRSCYTGFLRELLHRNCHTGVSFQVIYLHLISYTTPTVLLLKLSFAEIARVGPFRRSCMSVAQTCQYGEINANFQKAWQALGGVVRNEGRMSKSGAF